jgi:hypothetical protein
MYVFIECKVILLVHISLITISRLHKKIFLHVAASGLGDNFSLGTLKKDFPFLIHIL